MECNRDEALKAKEFAERKFLGKDNLGAKKLALRAQNLFPELDGINQMIATLNIYLASEVKIKGESDWYSILAVDPSADDETVRAQYRKLALQLHPDKNKSIGAEGAFKLISEAWSVLSDKSRRLAYDQKRNVKALQQRVSSRLKKRHSVTHANNGFFDFANNTSLKSTSQKSSTASTTFWTSCNRCKMQYEYLRVYLNHNLLCPNCHEAFMAVETGFPVNGATTNFSWTAPQQTKQSSKYSSVAAQAANMVHQTYEKVRREREEAQAAARREATLRRKISSRNGSAAYHDNVAVKKRRSITGDSGTQQISSDKVYRSCEMEKPNVSVVDARKQQRLNKIYKIIRENSEADKRRLLIEKVKGDIRQKLKEWNAAKTTDPRYKLLSEVGGNNSSFKKSEDPRYKSKQTSSTTDQSKPPVKGMTIVVPDPEFHDFDKDRLRRTFEGDQVWATYDSEDGMPRLYVLVKKVLSYRPFRIRMSFLNAKSNEEWGPMDWVACGYAKTCGDFKTGRYEVNDTVNIFSHRVVSEKGPRGAIRIVPRKGDTWALYKNWSPDWNELTPDDTVHKYEIVEIIEDYNEDQGVLVTPLVKIAGFRAVFHMHLDPKEARRIPREEMFRFSHQVPSYLLTGEEAHNAPKGCRELDPAAIPPEFLQVITEFKDDATVETAEQQLVT